MQRDLCRILFTREQIQARVQALAQEIAAAYPKLDAGLTLCPILSGSFIFTADLIRELPLKMKIALMQVSTYPGRATTPGQPQLMMELNGDITGRHVLLIDDILDSGRTIRRVRQLVGERRPASVRTAVLLRKPARAPADVPVEFVGFDVEDEFVVGYGLDFDDHYRNLPYIGVLKAELMA